MSETLILGLLAILVVLTVGLPLVRRLSAKPEPRAAAKTREPPSPDGGHGKAESPAPPGRGRIAGQVGRGSMKTVGDIVEKHPGEAVSVLRRWIRSDPPPES